MSAGMPGPLKRMRATRAAGGRAFFAASSRRSRDPQARAKYLGITGGGGLLLYLQMHENPTDLRAVLRDYARDMVLPALEIYTDGLMADRTMYDAFLAADDQGGSNVS